MMGRPHSSLVLLVTAFCLYSVTCETVRSLVLHHHHHHHHDSWVHDGLEKHVKKLTENGTIQTECWTKSSDFHKYPDVCWLKPDCSWFKSSFWMAKPCETLVKPQLTLLNLLPGRSAQASARSAGGSSYGAGGKSGNSIEIPLKIHQKKWIEVIWQKVRESFLVEIHL